MLIVRDPDGRFLLERRPSTGVWARLWSLPEAEDADAAQAHLLRRHDVRADPTRALECFVHTFSHYHLQITPLLLAGTGPAKAVADLLAYIRTLPSVEGRAPGHELAFPFNIRRIVGGWKLLFFDGAPFKADPGKSEEWNRGAYLVNGPGHCAECHSSRNRFGAIVQATRFAGGPDPEGRGWVPNITQAEDGLGKWSKSEIAELLKSGFTPNYDSVGGSMTAVVRNTAQLSDADRLAMAEYLKSLPAVQGPPRPQKAAGG